MAKSKPKVAGPQTKMQGLNGVGAEASAMVGLLFGNTTQPGTYRTYRQMLENPTVALAYAATCAPIISAAWSVEADDDAPEGAKELIEDVFEPMRAKLLAQCCKSIIFGWQGFEKVWTVDDAGYQVIERFKPLLPEYTDISIDKDTGRVIGLQQGDVKLDEGHCVLITNDSEAENPYGRSRFENIRRWAWKPWTNGMDKLAMYQAKTAGVIPVCRYPEGSGVNASGQTVGNYEAATQMLLQLQQAHGIAIPTSIPDWAMDAIRSGSNIADMMAWQVDFLESSPGHGAEFVASLEYQDKLIVRGMLLPERAILEGQFGTKAEAGVHGDIAVLISQQFLECVVHDLNRQAVDDLLRTNFGSSVVGKVYLTAGPIMDHARQLVQDIVKQLYAGSPDLALEQLDIDGMLDQLKLPKAAEDVSEESEETTEVTPVQTPEQTQPQPFSRTIGNAIKSRVKHGK